MTFTRPTSDFEVQFEELCPEPFELLHEATDSDPAGTSGPIFLVNDSHLLHGATVTVVFPCLNEELAVGLCVERALDVMRGAGIDGSVLVVDNGSTDNSARIAIDAGAQVILQREPGYGAALRSGIEAAQSEFVIMADADGTYELDAIPRLLLPLLTDDADMVLGQRLSDATTATMPWLHRYVGTPVITYLVKKATKNRVDIRDSQSGFRAFRREQILALNLSSTGMEFASEMLIRSSWAELRIGEVETKYAERIGDSKLSTFSDGLRHLREILLLSPETGATIPGILATVLAFSLWIYAAQSAHGFSQVGSLSWVANVVAGVLSILGPLVFCTGVVLKYRAENSGLRTARVKLPIEALIRRFLTSGVILLVGASLVLAALLVNFHLQAFLSNSIAASLSSFVRSAFVVGVVLAMAPLLSPLLITSPRSELPIASEEGPRANLRMARRVGETSTSVDICMACQSNMMREA